MNRTYRNLLIAISALILIAAGAFSKNIITLSSQNSYAIASGKSGAGYQNFSSALKELIGKEKLPFSLEVRETSGSVENISLLENGTVQFGLVQKTISSGNDVSVIAPLYRDVVHILLPSHSKIQALHELKGKRLALGLPGSGTELVNLQLLSHYGIAEEDVENKALPPELASKALLQGHIDAFMMVTALRAPVIEKLLSTGKVKFLNIGEAGVDCNSAHGIHEHFPHLEPYIIPSHTYSSSPPSNLALPQNPVSTLSVSALLVCNKNLSKRHVYKLTKALFENKHFLSQRVSDARHVQEITEATSLPYAIHPGAQRYYERNNPSFLVLYAEVIALIFSLLIASIGMVSALRRWAATRRKNRVDCYYHKINEILKRVHEEDSGVDLDEEEKALWALRYKAVEELASEKLTADESFRIFQTLLANCLKEVQWKRDHTSQTKKAP